VHEPIPGNGIYRTEDRDVKRKVKIKIIWGVFLILFSTTPVALADDWVYLGRDTSGAYWKYDSAHLSRDEAGISVSVLISWSDGPRRFDEPTLVPDGYVSILREEHFECATMIMDFISHLRYFDAPNGLGNVVYKYDSKLYTYSINPLIGPNLDLLHKICN
jgi:hypothetical protein